MCSYNKTRNIMNKALTSSQIANFKIYDISDIY